MAENNASTTAGAPWLQPRTEDTDFRRYAAFVWLHRWLIVICIVLGAGAAALYLATASPVYSAEADLFISPVSSANTATLALGLITDSGNPTGDVETAARLVSTTAAARAVNAALKLHESPQQTLHRVSALPVAQSNIVALTAEAGNARAAANLANTFANTVIAQRTAQFYALVRTEIASLNPQASGAATGAAEQTALAAQRAQLSAFLAAPLPDMRVSAYATPPTSPSSPRTTITIIGGLLGGLAIGLALAFGLEFVDVRVRREQQLHRLFRLPVLALIPREGGALRAFGRLIAMLPVVAILEQRRRIRWRVPLTPEVLSPAAAEAYRTLRATLLASRPQFSASRAVLVTSASAGEGKTTTAINLASSLATSGRKVILIEADLHRPSIARALGRESRDHVSSVLTGEVPMSEALLDSPSHGSDLRYLLARSDPEWDGLGADALLLPTAASLLSEALRLADFVIVDAPPLAEVIDALELARLVDDVLIVVRLGQTRVPRLVALGELLARSQIEPVGIALVGVQPSESYGYPSYTAKAPAAKPRSDVRVGRSASRT